VEIKPAMKICLYSPYIPSSFGGGEKYILDVALSLSKKHEVFLGVSNFQNQTEQQIKKAYETFLNKSLTQIKIIKTPLGTEANFLKKLLWTKKFNCLYYLTDGSLFFSLAKKNILHIQIPFGVKKNNILERIKLLNWQVKNTNSEFTKNVIEKNWKTKIDVVHHPKIDLKELSTTIDKKQKIILHVGRFFKQLHSKKQEELIKFFKELRSKQKSKLTNYKLVLIGSVEDEDYAKEIANLVKNNAIEIYHKTSRTELNNWYQKANIYWHATGYKQDEKKHPEKMEHFGISTIEAMAAGCIPIVINKGGQKEILTHELKSLLWDTKQQCLNKTIEIIDNKNLREKMSSLAIDRAKDFDGQIFEEKLNKMIG
jgi:glycosyltransferase involved in cell wall biosynthesis